MLKIKKTYENQLVEFYGLFKRFSVSQIMKMMNINSLEYNSFLGVVIKANKEGRDIKDSFVDESVQYSSDEDDYGFLYKRNAIITKEGLFSFENSPLMRLPSTELSIAVREYKKMCNQNNIKYD